MPQPEFTVVLAAYNEERYVADAIRSVLSQKVSSLELIVVDDGSTDSTVRVISEFSGDERLRLIRQRNHGLAPSLNTGATAGQAPMIALIDADDIWLPDHLERMRDTLNRCPQAGFVHTDGWRVSAATGRFHRRTYCTQMGMPDRPPCEPTETALSLLEGNWLLGLPAIRRRAFEEVGGFDETLPASEDYALWLNLLAHGYSAAFTFARTVVLRDRQGSMSKDSVAMYKSLAAVYRSAAREMPFPPQVQARSIALAAEMERLAASAGKSSPLTRSLRAVRSGLGRIRRIALARKVWMRGVPPEVERAYPGFTWQLD